jgi:hypothetical protein
MIFNPFLRFNSQLSTSATCFKVILDQINVVANLKPALITVYDYYKNSKATRHFYKVDQKPVCVWCA